MRAAAIVIFGILGGILLVGANRAWGQPLAVPPQAPHGTALPPSAGAEPGYFGVIVVDGGTPGALVRRVHRRGPADLAGLREGDILIAVAGREVSDAAEFGRALLDRRAGESIPIQYLRDGEARDAMVVLSPRPRPEDQLLPSFGRVPAAETNRGGSKSVGGSAGTPRDPDEPILLGVSTSSVSEAARRRLDLPHRRGALVVAVVPDSPAALAEIPVGAVIWAVDGRDVNTPEGLESRVRAAGAGARVMLSFYYGGQVHRRYVDLGGYYAGTPGGPALPPQESPTTSASGEVLRRGDLDTTGEGPSMDELRVRLDSLEARIRRLEETIERVARQLEHAGPSPPGDAPRP